MIITYKCDHCGDVMALLTNGETICVAPFVYKKEQEFPLSNNSEFFCIGCCKKLLFNYSRCTPELTQELIDSIDKFDMHPKALTPELQLFTSAATKQYVEHKLKEEETDE